MGATLGLATKGAKLNLNESKTLSIEFKDVVTHDPALYFGYNLDWGEFRKIRRKRRPFESVDLASCIIYAPTGSSPGGPTISIGNHWLMASRAGDSSPRV